MADGAVKFFENSKCLYGDGATVNTLTGSATKNNMLNWSKNSMWFSEGETLFTGDKITVTLPAPTKISAILLGDHNFSKFGLSYGSTNLLSSTLEDLSNATNWIRSNLTSVIESAYDTPFYNKPLYELTENSSNAEHYIENTYSTSVIGSQDYWVYFYVLPSNRSKVKIKIYDSSSTLIDQSTFDLSAETSSNANGSIELINQNVYRIGLKVRNPIASTSLKVRLQLLNAAGSETYSGSTVTVAIYAALPQLLPYASDSYYSGKNFTNIIGVNGASKTTAKESSFEAQGYYIEFDEVEVSQLNLFIYEVQNDEDEPENLLLYSNGEGGDWFSSALASYTANYAYNYKGEKEASFIQENSASSAHGRSTYILTQDNENYKLTFKIKALGRNNFVPAIYGVSSTLSIGAVNFDLSNGQVAAKGSSINSASISSLGEGWYKCIISFTSLTSGYSFLHFFLSDNSGLSSVSYAGDGSSGVLISEIQLARGDNPFAETTATEVISVGQKHLANFIATQKIGEFTHAGMTISLPDIDPNQRRSMNIFNKEVIQKGIETFTCGLNLNLTSNQQDVDLVQTIKDYDDPVIVYLSGGYSDSPYFRVNAKPYRLQDFYLVKDKAGGSFRFHDNLFMVGVRNNLTLVEVDN